MPPPLLTPFLPAQVHLLKEPKPLNRGKIPSLEQAVSLPLQGYHGKTMITFFR